MGSGVRSARAVIWGNAVSMGVARVDTARAAVLGTDPVHRIQGLGANPADWPEAWNSFESEGAGPLRLLLPVPGDVCGLPPGRALDAALQAGEAVLACGAEDRLVLIPESAGRGVVWRCWRVAGHGAQIRVSIGEAEGDLRRTIRSATEVLLDLDVAPWLGRELAGDLDPPPGLSWPPRYPARARDLYERGRRLQQVTTLALLDEGGGRHAAEIGTRRELLRRLNDAGRAAQMAALDLAPATQSDRS